MQYSLIGYLWIFVIYAFLGWCVEVAFHTVTSGKFVNRGFLNGPICPIYGVGMAILIFVLGPLVDNLILLFIGSIILTSILELITGYVLEKVFDTKWWDYSNLPFNIGGYISLSFSIAWGLGAVFVLNIIHAPIHKLISYLDNTVGYVLLLIFFSYFTIDFIITILGIKEINNRLRILNEVEEKLNIYSGHIGENIYKGMSTAIKAFGDSKSEIEAMKLKAKYDKLSKKKGFVHRRLEKSFPNIKDKIAHLEEHKKPKSQ
ncbi:MAG: putative ABC transporter permease [Epulopiscium sp.]|nr:putative ABC transporter permease [Candidatus Epulonipiscium sp.]